MVDNGDGGKKIWTTEYGEPTSVVDEGTQAAYLTDFLTKWRTLPYAGPAYLYTTRDRNTGSGAADDTFGVYRSDWTPKPAQQAGAGAGLSRSADQSDDRPHRDRQPARPVPGLVAHLVRRLVEFVGGEQVGLVVWDRCRRRRHIPRRTTRSCAPPIRGRGRPAACRAADRRRARRDAGRRRTRRTAAHPRRPAAASRAAAGRPAAVRVRPRSRSAASARACAAPGRGAGRRARAGR